jgi:Icc-related predicted phosphoesterase
MTARIVVMSDSHMRHEQLAVPGGDILVHCGDALAFGTADEWLRFVKWFRSQPHAHKVYVPGNHCLVTERAPEWSEAQLMGDVHMLIDEEVRIDGLRFYGTPWVPECGQWSWMQLRGSAEMSAKRRAIPAGLDILVSHAPAFGILDDTRLHIVGGGDGHLGCAALRSRLEEAPPRVHLHGHIHEAHGIHMGRWLTVNAATTGYAIEVTT